MALFQPLRNKGGRKRRGIAVYSNPKAGGYHMDATDKAETPATPPESSATEWPEPDLSPASVLLHKLSSEYGPRYVFGSCSTDNASWEVPPHKRKAPLILHSSSAISGPKAVRRRGRNVERRYERLASLPLHDLPEFFHDHVSLHLGAAIRKVSLLGRR
jgi:hypothetical protein